MNKFIAKVFKSAGVNAKVSKNAENPRFKVVENKLTLEGIVKPNRYIMTITDNTGKKIDNLSVAIDNSNDVVNRINESINTLKMLSKAYENQKLTEEDEEYVEVSADEKEPASLTDGLSVLYDTILNVAEQAESLVDLASENPEDINRIIGITSGLYDCAIDADEFIEDLTEEDEEEVDEGIIRKTSKSNIDKVLNSLTIAESAIRRNKDMKDILEAIKDIKSEIIVRGH